jgi:hypothetical protein
MKNFNVTFTPKSKYNSITRTVNVVANDEYHAKYLVNSEFGSFKRKGGAVTEEFSDKISISKVKEIKEKKEKK